MLMVITKLITANFSEVNFKNLTEATNIAIEIMSLTIQFFSENHQPQHRPTLIRMLTKSSTLPLYFLMLITSFLKQSTFFNKNKT